MKLSRTIEQRARAERIYALLLRLYPAAHRQAFEPQMLHTFRDHYRDAIETEGEHELRFWLQVTADTGTSLFREHLAALKERKASMKKLLLLALVVGVGALLWFLAMVSFGDPLVTFTLVGMIIAGLLAIIARFVRTFPRPAMQPSWLRIGLVLGGILSLSVVVSTVISGLLPAPSNDRAGWILMSLPPLLTGVVGVIGGYLTGTTRTGVFAGLLAGCIGLAASLVSQILLTALLWQAIQRHQVQSSLTLDYQYWLQFHQPRTLGNFLSFELLENSFVLIGSPIVLAVEGLFAALGGALGAGFRRAGSVDHRVALPQPRPLRFVLTILALSLLLWAGAAEFQSLYVYQHLLSLRDLGSAFTAPSGVSWLLGFLVVFAFVFVATRPEASAAAR